MNLCILLLILELAFVSVKSFLEECNQVCGTPDIQPISHRIVGGHESVLGSLPWMTFLTFGNVFRCGGAIINRQVILTAAHCFDARSKTSRKDVAVQMHEPSNWKVFAGRLSIIRGNDGERQYEVDRIVIHSLYDNNTLINDIALVKLKEDIIYSHLIRPVCLPLSTAPANGMACIVSGYGHTLGLETFSLHQATVPIVSDETCTQEDWYGLHYYFPPAQFCAGYEQGGRDSCDGDSGSPLICEFDGKWYASGIVSKGKTCAQPRKPGVYTNVSYHSLWIDLTMAEFGFLPPCY